MRIGVMLRALDEQGGIGVYAANITRELLDLDGENEYVLFYRNRGNLGRFAGHPCVSEVYVWAPNKALWDQVAIPLACLRHRVNVVFHPKFTVPFLAPCKTVMVVHGADWFIPDQAQFYGFWDVRYVRLVMPWYFRRASRVISVSRLTTENFQKALDPPPGKLETIYFAPARNFGPVPPGAQRQRVRNRYGLPERFILTLTKLGDGNRKNFSGLIRGYARYHAEARRPLKLVIGGKGCERLVEDYDLPADGYGEDLVFPGWIDQGDLPAVYSSADLFLYPSNLEAFPIPITEAMACGTPIVTSRANGLEELAGDAAFLVDPRRPDEIGRGVARVLEDEALRANLSRKGRERAPLFNWDECARKTLETIEGTNRSPSNP
jgi:glycosyltransferase involved in cell wall biosynthesis